MLSVCKKDDAQCLHHRHVFLEHRGGEKWCASLNVNGAMRSVQANMKAGLSSFAVTVSTPRVIFMLFLSNFGFHWLTCYNFYIFAIQTIMFLLYYEFLLIFLSFYALNSLLFYTLSCCLQWNVFHVA
jgi:hypothetical protein